MDLGQEHIIWYNFTDARGFSLLMDVHCGCFVFDRIFG